MKRLAVLSAVHTAQLLQNNGTTTGTSAPGKDARQQGYSMSSGGRSGRYEPNLHGNVNVLLGGAMLGGVIAVIFFVCYCCHRSMRKNRPHEYSPYWRPEPDVHSLEVFTMDAHAMCYDRNAMSLHSQQQLQPLPEELTASTVAQPRPATPGPPPAYESLIFKPCLASPSDKKPGGGLSPLGCILPVPLDIESGGHRALKEEESHRDDEGLPSYEAALKLEAHGYV